MNVLLPKRLTEYIHDTGVRTLDHLADGVNAPAEGETPDTLQTLVAHWREMTPESKVAFIERISVAIGEVIAAAALLPLGVAVGKKAVKSARKVLKRSAKTIKKKTRAARKAIKDPAGKKSKKK